MNRRGGIMLLLLLICLCLSGKTVRAEAAGVVAQIQVNGRRMENDEEAVWLGRKDLENREERVSLCFWGEGERNLVISEKAADDHYEERDLVYQEVTEETYVLATGKVPEHASVWVGEYSFPAEKSAYFFRMKCGADAEAFRELPVIRIDRIEPEIEAEILPAGFRIRMAEKEPDFLNIAGRITRKADVTAESEVFLEAAEFIWKEINGEYITEITVCEEGVYELELLALDMAGNESERVKESFCLDQTPPVTEGLHVFAAKKKLEPVRGTYYSDTGVRMELAVTDNVSGIRTASVWIRRSGDQQTDPEELVTYDFEEAMPYTVLEAELPDIGEWEVGICMEDGAGNRTKETEWLWRIVIEEEKPILHMDVSGKTGEHRFYTGDAKLVLAAEDEQSRIYEAKLLADGKLIKEWRMKDGGTISGEHFTLSAGAFDGEVPVLFQARDLAGNTSTYETVIKMDAKAPVMELEWKAGQAINEFYYTKERKAILRIWETNFNENGIEIFHGTEKQSRPLFRKMPEEDCYAAELIFSEDGVYELRVEGKDLAGNVGTALTEKRFIIDRTPPVIWVRYEDGEEGKEAFSQKRKAQITVREDNPDITGVELQVFLDGNEEILSSETKLFGATGEGMAGNVCFEKEGEYHWSLQAVDLAGNRSILWESEVFLQDFTEPLLTLKGIKDGTSVNGAVQLAVEGEDRWLKKDSLEAVIYRDGVRLDVDMTRKNADGEQMVSFASFPMGADWDGHYVMEAACEDVAGNQTQQEWSFTVNRFGSSLSIGKSLQNTVERYYINKVPAILLTERNADALVEQTLFFQDESGMRLLTEGEDYRIVHSKDAAGWHAYIYEIAPEVFRTDGACDLSLHTKDAAGNMLDSRTTIPLSFFLDRHGPVIQLKESEVYISGKSPIQKAVFWLDAEQIALYTEEEILEAQGIFRLYPQDKAYSGMLVVEAWDAAGNHVCTEPLLLGNASEECAEEPSPEEERMEKTAESIWIRIWILVLCIVICTLIVHFIKKQKENKDDSC